jgi:hypothetical protein
MKTFKTPAELVTFLTETLIPDLRESGTDATADDFQKCVDTICSLEKKVKALNMRLTGRYTHEEWLGLKCEAAGAELEALDSDKPIFWKGETS